MSVVPCNPAMTDVALASVAMVDSVSDECLGFFALKHGSAFAGSTGSERICLKHVCACSKYQRRAELQLSSQSRKLLFIIVDLSPVTDIDASAVHFLMVSSTQVPVPSKQHLQNPQFCASLNTFATFACNHASFSGFTPCMLTSSHDM